MTMPRRYYLEDLALDDAWRRFEQALERAGGLMALPAERVSLADALGRITCAPIWARLSSPHYHAAAMDDIAERARVFFQMKPGGQRLMPPFRSERLQREPAVGRVKRLTKRRVQRPVAGMGATRGARESDEREEATSRGRSRGNTMGK